MKMNVLNTRKICLIVCLGLFVVGLACAVYFRLATPHFTPTPDNVSDFKVYLNSYDDASLEERDKGLEYSSPEEMIDNTELIVKVIHNGEWKMKEGCIESPVTISRVYKGDLSLEGKIIYVIEPGTFYNTDIGGKWYSTSFEEYSLMLPQHEYLLFLKLRSFPEGYIYSEEEKITYLLVNNYLGKYSLNVQDKLELISSSPDLTYRDVMNSEIITCTPAVLERYKTWKSTLFEYFQSANKG